MGGKKDPCEAPHTLAKIELDTGRPCPRVELSYQNAPSAELLGMLIDMYKKHLVTAIVGPLLHGRTAQNRLNIIRRVCSALSGTERITDKLYPEYGTPDG